MQHEIETAQKELGVVEERVLERMMEADALTADVKKAEAGARRPAEGSRRGEEDARRGARRTVEAALKEATEQRRRCVEVAPAAAGRALRAGRRARKGVAICAATRDGSAPPATSVCGRRCFSRSAGTTASSSATAASASSTTFHHRRRSNRPSRTRDASTPAFARSGHLAGGTLPRANVDGGSRGNPGPAGYGVRIEQRRRHGRRV